MHHHKVSYGEKYYNTQIPPNKRITNGASLKVDTMSDIIQVKSAGGGMGGFLRVTGGGQSGRATWCWHGSNAGQKSNEGETEGDCLINMSTSFSTESPSAALTSLFIAPIL